MLPCCWGGRVKRWPRQGQQGRRTPTPRILARSRREFAHPHQPSRRFLRSGSIEDLPGAGRSAARLGGAVTPCGVTRPKPRRVCYRDAEERVGAPTVGGPPARFRRWPNVFAPGSVAGRAAGAGVDAADRHEGVWRPRVDRSQSSALSRHAYGSGPRVRGRRCSFCTEKNYLPNDLRRQRRGDGLRAQARAWRGGAPPRASRARRGRRARRARGPSPTYPPRIVRGGASKAILDAAGARPESVRAVRVPNFPS